MTKIPLNHIIYFSNRIGAWLTRDTYQVKSLNNSINIIFLVGASLTRDTNSIMSLNNNKYRCMIDEGNKICIMQLMFD